MSIGDALARILRPDDTAYAKSLRAFTDEPANKREAR